MATRLFFLKWVRAILVMIGEKGRGLDVKGGGSEGWEKGWWVSRS